MADPSFSRFVLQTRLSLGKQPVHTEYLKLLTAMAIGLGMEALLVSPPHPPHLLPVPTPLHWQWLKNFTSAVSMACSFRKKQPLAIDETTLSLDLPPLHPGEKFQPRVRCVQSSLTFIRWVSSLSVYFACYCHGVHRKKLRVSSCIVAHSLNGYAQFEGVCQDGQLCLSKCLVWFHPSLCFFRMVWVSLLCTY